MNWVWTCSGECFGYRIDDALYTYWGLQIGHIEGDEVYGADGKYLGDIQTGNRLVTKKGKKHQVRQGFTPAASGSYVRTDDLSACDMDAGCEDFPTAEHFKGLFTE